MSQTDQEALKPEPDLSWIDIAVTRNREVTLINFSEGWREFIECIWWEDNFVSDPPNLAPGAYRWSGYQINFWAEDEHCNVTGGTFTPYRTEPSANCSGEPVVDDIAWLIEHAGTGTPLYWTGHIEWSWGGFNNGRWSADHMEACRFSRREDALKICAGISAPESDLKHKVVEHLWHNSSSAPANTEALLKEAREDAAELVEKIQFLATNHGGWLENDPTLLLSNIHDLASQALSLLAGKGGDA